MYYMFVYETIPAYINEKKWKKYKKNHCFFYFISNKMFCYQIDEILKMNDNIFHRSRQAAAA